MKKAPSDRRQPPAAAHDLLGALGARVRAAREARNESRGALARRAGLSLRFLAQLESGHANISLLRLNEVAQALEIELTQLLGAAAVTHPAGAAAHAGIALLGLRGAGKSSVGERLARDLGLEFSELDGLIERDAGMRLEQIFELQGEAAYRRLERQALRRHLEGPPGVLATGGGLVTDSETYALLRERCRTVWLRATPEEHWSRVVRQGDRRPMRDNPEAMRELCALLAARAPLYALANWTVDTSGRSIRQVAEAVVRHLRAGSLAVARRGC